MRLAEMASNNSLQSRIRARGIWPGRRRHSGRNRAVGHRCYRGILPDSATANTRLAGCPNSRGRYVYERLDYERFGESSPASGMLLLYQKGL
jgi:hypothetical protein